MVGLSDKCGTTKRYRDVPKLNEYKGYRLLDRLESHGRKRLYDTRDKTNTPKNGRMEWVFFRRCVSLILKLYLGVPKKVE